MKGKKSTEIQPRQPKFRKPLACLGVILLVISIFFRVKLEDFSFGYRPNIYLDFISIFPVFYLICAVFYRDRGFLEIGISEKKNSSIIFSENDYVTLGLFASMAAVMVTFCFGYDVLYYDRIRYASLVLFLITLALYAFSDKNFFRKNSFLKALLFLPFSCMYAYGATCYIMGRSVSSEDAFVGEVKNKLMSHGTTRGSYGMAWFYIDLEADPSLNFKKIDKVQIEVSGTEFSRIAIHDKLKVSFYNSILGSTLKGPIRVVSP